MKVTIDKRGRIVIPRELRLRLGLRPSMKLEIAEHAGGIELRVPGKASSLAYVNGLLVHCGRWEKRAELNLENIREERVRELIKI